MRILETKIGTLAVMLLPTALRQPVMMALAMWLVMPMQKVLAALTEWRGDTIERLGYNGQICNMERCLNDLFDPEERRIRIVDGQMTSSEPYYLYVREADYTDMPGGRGEEPVVWLESRDAISETIYDFVVEVPETVLRPDGTERRLRTIVDRYKMPGKRWTLTTNYKY